MPLALAGLYAADALTTGTGSSKEVDEELFKYVEDDEEDMLVYKGENTEAVINQNGRVKTAEEEFNIPDHTYRQLVGKADELNALEETTGLETEQEGQTDQHIYLGEKQNYTGEIDQYTEEELEFQEFEQILEENQDYMERLKN
jgi:hypothetical protein